MLARMAYQSTSRTMMASSLALARPSRILSLASFARQSKSSSSSSSSAWYEQASSGPSSSSSQAASSIHSAIVHELKPPTNFGFVIVRHQEACVVERMGKFHQVLDAGLHFLIPILDQVSYRHNLRELVLPVNRTSAVTRDNVSLMIDAVLYVRIVDPQKASYNVEHPIAAITQLAMTSMRSELGKLTLDRIFSERELLNHNLVKSIAAAAEGWGLQLLRYEIRDISPPTSIRFAMDQQAEAERRKRASILESEGIRESETNIATGKKMASILYAEGEANAIITRATATSEAVQSVADAISQENGKHAMDLQLAEQFFNSYSQLAKPSTLMLMHSNVSDPAAMVSGAMSTLDRIASYHRQPNTAQIASSSSSQSQQQPVPFNSNDLPINPSLSATTFASPLDSYSSSHVVPGDTGLPPSFPLTHPDAPAGVGSVGLPAEADMDDLDRQYFGKRV